MGDSQDLADALFAIYEVFNDDLDEPVCFARCPHGGCCGKPRGHDGLHDSDGHCQWGTDQ